MVSMIKPNLEILEKVQLIDSEIYQAQGLIREIPGQMQALDEQAKSERVRLSQLENELKPLQLKQKEKEMDLASKEAAIKKYEVQQTQVKTNKEYSSLQSEISSMKADNSLLEEEIITLIDQVEDCQKRLKAEQECLREVEQSVQQGKKAFEEKADEAKKKVEELKTKKKEMIKEVDPEIAALYEKIISKKQGFALAKVEGESCPACQMRLRPQLLNELQQADHVVVCEQCSRILYLV